MTVDLAPIARFFWDSDFAALSWESHRNFTVRRILQSGDFQALKWLRAQVGDEGLKAWIIARDGRDLDPRQIRYWALILDIDATMADEWVTRAKHTIWEQRR